MVPDTQQWELHAWIAVDWDEHGRMLLTSATATVDDRWTEGINPGLSEQADGFGKLLREYGLNPVYGWDYSPALRDDPVARQNANELMNLKTKAIKAKPAGAIEDSQSNRIAGLTELSYGSESAFRE